MPTLAPDNTPSNVAYGSRQGQPAAVSPDLAAVSPALAHQLSLAELLSDFAALKSQLADQAAENKALKSQLAAHAAENAALKSNIPQSDQSISSSNSQSSICNQHSDNPQSAIRTPHSPDPIAAAFAPLFDNPVEHYIPGGGHTMPIIPREARTNQAGLERLKYLASRAELALVEYVDRFAVCGIVGSPERATFEFIMRNIWRQTAVRKSLIAMEANPNAPVPDDVCPNLFSSMTEMNMDPVAEINEARAAVPDKSPSPSPSPSQSSPVNPVHPVHEVNNVNTVNTVNNIHPVPPIPASPSIPMVPQCPTYSPENMVRTLNRTTNDLSSAGILPAQSPSPSPSQSPSVHSVHDVNDVNNVHSVHPTPDIGPLTLAKQDNQEKHVDLQTVVFIPYADPATLATLPPQPPDPPCPKATDPAAPRPQCTECDAELCPSRIAVPLFTGILERTRKCDGACRFCSPQTPEILPLYPPQIPRRTIVGRARRARHGAPPASGYAPQV